jgi:cystathionine beta-lyase/cystathionine gamma-synthase
MASRQLDFGGGMLSFELGGGAEVGPAFIDGLAIAELTASLGSVHTMVVHPPTTSHRQLSEEDRLAAGIGPGLLRVSVGLEDLDDLIGDFERGLAGARAVAARQRTEPVPASTILAGG